VGLLWISLAAVYSALEETLHVPVVTGCILVLKHTVKLITCEVFVVVVVTLRYYWQVFDNADFFN